MCLHLIPIFDIYCNPPHFYQQLQYLHKNIDTWILVLFFRFSSLSYLISRSILLFGLLWMLIVMEFFCVTKMRIFIFILRRRSLSNSRLFSLLRLFSFLMIVVKIWLLPVLDLIRIVLIRIRIFGILRFVLIFFRINRLFSRLLSTSTRSHC